MNAPFRTLAVRSPFIDEYDRFEDLAGRCKAAGVTHLTMTELPRSYWEIDDPEDPYLHWAIVHTSVFKICPPELLQGWVPKEYVEQAKRSVARRGAILKKIGLRGAAFFYDPMYWPEAVFEQHPELRGPRVDHPLRCRHWRFAPCTDRPEVREMYKRAFRELHELSGGTLDLIVMRTCDSGTGFCWSELYNEPNGPEACRGTGAVERAARFMQAALDGIREAGGKAEFYLQSARLVGDRSADTQTYLRNVPPECGVYVHHHSETGGERILTGNPSNFPLFPIRGVPGHVEVLQRLASAHQRGWPGLIFFTLPTMYGNDWEGEPLVTRAMELFNKEPRSDFVSLVEITRKMAAERYGDDNAGDVVTAWWDIFHAGETLQKNQHGLNLLFIGSLAQRWLTRPFVVFPEELTDAERAHYRPYLFEAGPSHEKDDLLDCQGSRQFDGRKHIQYFLRHLASARRKYNNARACLARAAERKGKHHEELREQAAALEILECLLINIWNVAEFQTRVEAVKARLEAEPAYRTSEAIKTERGEINNVIRSEIDNTHRLAGMLERTGCRHLVLAPTEQEETPFLLGPEFVVDLRRKAEIMMRHWKDVDRLIAPPNY